VSGLVGGVLIGAVITPGNDLRRLAFAPCWGSQFQCR
jgi:hypothetical protein